jgi:hypothetical protein
MQRSPLFSREAARVLVGGRLSRVLNWLSISQQELARQLSSHTPGALTTLSAAHLSNMIAGRRDLSGHLSDIVRVLAARVIPGERLAAAQEFRDWYGLLGVPLPKSEQFEGWFPGWPIPRPELAADNSPDHDHVSRPALLERVANELLKQSLIEDDWAGLFHRRQVVALTGMPGAGKRTLARQFIAQAHPFFAGGILYGDLQSQTAPEVLRHWARRMGHAPRAGESVQSLSRRLSVAMNERGGRWLCLIENVADGNLSPMDWMPPSAWGVLTTHCLNLARRNSVNVPPFDEDETVALLKLKLRGKWDKFNDPQRGRRLHHLVEGLPAAVSVIADRLSASRSKPVAWKENLSLLELPEKAVAHLKLGDTLAESLRPLSAEAQQMLGLFGNAAAGQALPKSSLESLARAHSLNDVSGIYQELSASGLLFDTPNDYVECVRAHRLVALYLGGQIDPKQKPMFVEWLASELSAAGPHLFPPEWMMAEWYRRQHLWLHLPEVRRYLKWARRNKEQSQELRHHLNWAAAAGGAITCAMRGPEECLAWIRQLFREFSRAEQYELFDAGSWLMWADAHLASGSTTSVIHCMERMARNSRCRAAHIRGWVRQIRAHLVEGNVDRAHGLLRDGAAWRGGAGKNDTGSHSGKAAALLAACERACVLGEVEAKRGNSAKAEAYFREAFSYLQSLFFRGDEKRSLSIRMVLYARPCVTLYAPRIAGCAVEPDLSAPRGWDVSRGLSNGA